MKDHDKISQGKIQKDIKSSRILREKRKKRSKDSPQTKREASDQFTNGENVVI